MNNELLWMAVIGLALACLALHELGHTGDRLNRGIKWLLSAWPAEHHWWWRVRTRFARRAQAVTQDCALAGWSWTPSISMNLT